MERTGKAGLIEFLEKVLEKILTFFLFRVIWK